MTRRFILPLLLLLSLATLWGQSEAPLNITDLASAQDTLSLAPAKLDSLFYAADSVAYNYSAEQIRLFGSSSVRYHNFDISSDSLMLDLKTEKAYSYGNTVMKDGDQILLGTTVAYDIDSQTGLLSRGVSRLENGYYSGQEIRKTGDDIYDVDNGSYTTCDHAEPDFWFSSKQLRIYRGDKIVGKPVIAYVNHFPVFYFPFMTLSIKRGRRAGFLVPEPGYNYVDGKTLRNIAWYYPYKSYADIILSLDLMEKTGWETRLTTDYIKRYLYSGSLDASYRKNIGQYETNYDWSLRARHHHELGEKSTFDVNLDFVSSKRIWEDSYNLDESLAQKVTSTVSYRKPLLSSYLNVGATYTEDLINDRISVSLPSVSFSAPTRPVYELFYNPTRSPNAWWSNLSYSYSFRMDHTGTSRNPDRGWADIFWNNEIDPADTTNTNYLTQHFAGIKHRLGLSYNWKFMGWLNFQNGVNYNESWFDRDRKGDNWVRGNDYGAYANANFNIYGIRNFRKGLLRSLRHIMTPSAGLNYSPDFSDNSRFYSFGGIGLNSSGKTAALSYGLNHKWQLKYGKDNKKTGDILTFNSRGSVNLMQKEKKLGLVSHTLNFSPGTFGLGNFRLPGSALNLKSLNLGYSSQFSFSQDPYELRDGKWKMNNQYFSHSISLSGTAPYTRYFSREKNKIFSPYEHSDSLRSGATQTSGSSSNENWKLTLSQDISGEKGIFQPSSSNLRLNASLKVTDNWYVTYGNYYNLKEKDLISQSVNLSRDLHCWKLEVSYSTRNEYWEYRIALFNTSLPDALRFQTRDSKNY